MVFKNIAYMKGGGENLSHTYRLRCQILIEEGIFVLFFVIFLKHLIYRVWHLGLLHKLQAYAWFCGQYFRMDQWLSYTFNFIPSISFRKFAGNITPYCPNIIILVRQNLGEPSNVVYSFVLGIKWKLRMSRFRICMMPPWHPWAFCAIQDGVQDGHHFKQTSRTPPLFNIERWFWCQTLCFYGQGIHWNN
jgi:hypothetical protein